MSSLLLMDSPFQPSELYASLEEDRKQGLILSYSIHSQPKPASAPTAAHSQDVTPPSSEEVRLWASATVRLLEGSFVDVKLDGKGFFVIPKSEENPTYYEALPNLLRSISPKYKQRWHSVLFSKLNELQASMMAEEDSEDSEGP